MARLSFALPLALLMFYCFSQHPAHARLLVSDCTRTTATTTTTTTAIVAYSVDHEDALPDPYDEDQSTAFVITWTKTYSELLLEDEEYASGYSTTTQGLFGRVFELIFGLLPHYRKSSSPSADGYPRDALINDPEYFSDA